MDSVPDSPAKMCCVEGLDGEMPSAFESEIDYSSIRGKVTTDSFCLLAGIPAKINSLVMLFKGKFPIVFFLVLTILCTYFVKQPYAISLIPLCNYLVQQLPI